jgi:hypothetical protein
MLRMLFLDVIIICILYKLTLSYEAQFTLQPKIILSELVWIFIAGTTLLAGWPEQIFSPGPEPALGGPVCVSIALWNNSYEVLSFMISFFTGICRVNS